jgi:hypothetical protein
MRMSGDRESTSLAIVFGGQSPSGARGGDVRRGRLPSQPGPGRRQHNGACLKTPPQRQMLETNARNGNASAGAPGDPDATSRPMLVAVEGLSPLHLVREECFRTGASSKCLQALQASACKRLRTTSGSVEGPLFCFTGGRSSVRTEPSIFG